MPSRISNCALLTRRLGPYFAQERRFHCQSSLRASKAGPGPSPLSKPYIAPRSSTQTTHSPAPAAFSLWGKVKSVFGYGPHVIDPNYVSAPFTFENNPYRARTKWPPDFSKLSKLEQFRLEKSYRRRSKLKWTRPTWNKWTKIVQNVLIYGTIFWWVFFLQMEDEGEVVGTPFDAFRSWFFPQLKAAFGWGDLEEMSKVDDLRNQRSTSKESSE